jgi:hypothetical protein
VTAYEVIRLGMSGIFVVLALARWRSWHRNR